MEKSDISKRVVKCINYVKNNKLSLTEENYDSPLTGENIRMSSVEMTYLILELMKEFGIRFEKTDVENYGLNSINKITNAIKKKIQ